MQKIKDLFNSIKWLVVGFFTSTQFKRFCWNTLSSLLITVSGYLSGLVPIDLTQAVLISLAVAFVNGVTKETNSYLTARYAE